MAAAAATSSNAAAAADPSSVRLELEQGNRKQPKRLVYFSDGVLEEYSSSSGEDSDTEGRHKRSQRLLRSGQGSSLVAASSRSSAAAVAHLDPRDLAWLPWFWHCGCRVGRGLLRTADYCGERVARLLGITTPKYGYIIREYHRIREEEEKERLERVAELEARKRYEAERAQPPPPAAPAAAAALPVSGGAD